jgi:hypothetical protein
VAGAAVAPAVRKAVEILVGETRQIPAAYRWTGKAPPTRASPFVPLAVKALGELFSGSAALARLCEDAARTEWAAEAAGKVTDKYVEVVRDTMGQARMGPPGKAAAKAKAPDGSDESRAVSDQEKMEMQLALDVDAFVQQLHEQLLLPASVTDPLLVRLRAVARP